MLLRARTVRGAIAVAVAAALLAIGAAPAQAQAVPVPQLSCTVDLQATLSPPLTLLPSPQSFGVTAQGNLTSCVPITSQAEGLESATFTASGTGTTTLCLAATSTGSGELLWNTGATGTFDYQFNLNPLVTGVDLVMTITITGGPLAGSSGLVAALPSISGTCVTGGISGFQVVTASLTLAG